MNIIHSISTDEFDPISLGKNYLYNQYDKLLSFIVKNIGEEYKFILAKPVLTEETVNWYSEYDKPLKRLDSFSEEENNQIKNSYWKLMKSVQDKIELLSVSKNKEKVEWSNLLNAVFNDDNNVIFSDGTTIVLLWGWKFNNRNENFLPAHFITKELRDQSSPIEDDVNNKNIPQPIPVFFDEEEKINETPVENAHKLTWWQKLMRFLRYFMYRYWRLLLLILLILFLLCLFRKCCDERCNSCDDYNLINKSLLDLEDRLRDKCPDLEIIEEDETHEEDIIEEDEAIEEDEVIEANNDTIIDNVQVQKPTENCRAHFSGGLISDTYHFENISLLYNIDEMSEYVGAGNYPRGSTAFPKAHSRTFDAIAIDKGTSVKIYSEENFQGEILLDETGPAIILNNYRMNEFSSTIEEILTKRFKGPLNSNFPPSCRKLSKSNMINWSEGSLKVMCEN